MPSYRLKFTVEGSGDFPIDMLRYDHCYPATSTQSAIIPQDAEQRRVRLAISLYSTKTNMDRCIKSGILPCVERWKSFGWEVLREETEAIRLT